MTTFNRTNILKCERLGFFIGVVLIVLLPKIAFSQSTAKRFLTEKDYALWHYLSLEEISNDGSWISYRNYYQSTDTLFLKNSKTKKTYHFAKGAKGTFKGDYYVCKTADEVLTIVSLKTGRTKTIQNVQKMAVYSSFIVVEQTSEGQKAISFVRFDGTLLVEDSIIVEYAVSPDEKLVCVIHKEGTMNDVSLLKISDFKSTTLISQLLAAGNFTGIKWQDNNASFAFFEANDMNSKLHYYDLVTKKMSTLSSLNSNFPETMNMYTKDKIRISQDGQRVFFMIRQKKELNVVHNSNAVQVWNAKDKAIYPSAVAIADFKQNPKQVMWEPRTERFLQITDTLQPFGAAAGADSYALTFNPQAYEPQSKIVPDTDYYIKDLSTGKSKLLVKQLCGGHYNVLASPQGKYVSYFKKGHWFIYSVATGNVINTTENIDASFDMESLTEVGEMAYGSPGWSINDESFLVYDKFDIWKVQTNGEKAERLTQGREVSIRYRIIPQKAGQQPQYDGRIFTLGTINLNSTLLLNKRSIDNDYNGFSIWRTGNGIKDICYSRKKRSGIAQSENDVYVWTEESVNQPTRIMARSLKEKQQLLVDSNLQHKNFHWTKEELVTFKNAQGDELKGILYFPADFNAEKRYPMVVSIYEKQSHFLHTYTHPTLLNVDGFNSVNLTSKGYFVFLPDITYRSGEIGASALDCVQSGVNAVLDKGNVDKDKIGLIGHSFGGTETAFIITQTNLFKCAVAGAATTNFLSSYLSVARNYGIPNFSKIEFGQARMLVSPYEDMSRYLKNSAVLHTAKVDTPLLSWTGLLDQQVDATQSMEFYMALRRLNKDHVMLVYPDAEHDMSGRKEGADLTRKIEDWFDYYLKNEAYPKWM